MIRARTVQLRNLLMFRRHTMPRSIAIRHRLLHSPDSGAGARNALAPSEAAVAVGGGRGGGGGGCRPELAVELR